MANPSSTSSKRLVGLGLRGIRNSPPTQMTAQIKSVLSHHSPRTSPTLSSSPTSPKSTISTKAVSPVTAITSSMPSSSITSTATGVISPHPGLRTCGRLRSFQGTLACASPNGVASANVGMGGTRSSPLIESFTPPASGLSIPSVTTSGQKGVTRITGLVPAKVDGAGDTGGVVKKPSSSGAPCQMFDGRRGAERLKGADNGAIGIPPTLTTNTCSSFGPGIGSRLSLGVSDALDDVADNRISPEVTLGDYTRDSVQRIQDSHKNRGTPGGNEPDQPLQTSQAQSQSQSSYARTPIQRGSESYSSKSRGFGSARLGTTALPTVSPCLPAHPFVDVPFPLHPEKTFRIHTSPLVGSPMGSTDAQLKTPGRSDVTPPPSIMSLTSSALPTSVSCPFPSASSSSARLSPRLSAAFKNLKAFSSALPHRISSSFSTAVPRRNSGSNSNIDSELTLSPNTHKRMFTPINEDMYKSPPSPCSRISSPGSPSFERSPSSVMLLSSRVHWLRRSEKDEEEESHRETNYSTMCSPSSSPFLHRGTTSMSASPSLSPRRTKSGYYSPVAKIETILGPRERGIECVPERRDYECSYSRLRMSPGSLTPLEEDKSLDLNAFMDEIESKSLGENERSSLSSSSEDLGFGGSTSRASGEGNGEFHASWHSVSGLPVTSSPIPGPGPGGLAFNSASGAKAVATARAGLRRKVTGVGSPLAQCVATWDNASCHSSRGDGIEFEDEEDCETPMSPILMRAKDSLLLKDVQRKKRTTVGSGTEEVAGSTGQTTQVISVSTSAPPGIKWGISSGRTHTAPSNPDAAERVSLLLTFKEMSPSLPNPFRSPSQSTPLAEVTPLGPLTLVAQIQPPETPTIRPSTRTASGSRDLDDAISPLQLSSPTFPFTAIMKDSPLAEAPLAASVPFNLGALCVASEPRQQRATYA